MTKKGKYTLGLAAAFLLFWTANVIERLRPECYDCHARHGVPFAYVRDGGWVGNWGFLWPGLVADLVVVVLVGLLLGAILSRFAGKL